MAEPDALALFNEVRAAFGEPPLTAAALSVDAQRELGEAQALLLMLAGRLRDPAHGEPVGATVKDELRQAWNKALRRRGWKALPALDAPVASQTPRAASAGEDPAQLVAAFLACFGATFVPAAVSRESLALAHALCVALLSEIDSLRAAQPLLPPEQYALRYAALVDRWNELARRAQDLPALPG